MFKKILFPVLLLLTFSAQAQLNNSWIIHTQPYFKFILGNDTLIRIPQSTLASAGLASVNADHFQLWRNGKEVRLYTSVSGTALGASDFIEFYGKKNDGKADTELYRDPNHQINDAYSLETDTVAYFLTVHPATTNLRFQGSLNAAPAANTPDAYCIRNVTEYMKYQLNKGFAVPYPEYVYSSTYDEGEGWASGSVAPNFDLYAQFTNLNASSAGPANGLTVNVSAVGVSPHARNLRIKLGNNILYNSPLPNFASTKVSLPNLPTNYISTTANVYIGSVSSIATARLAVGYIGLSFPATFNFNASKVFEFETVASATGNYLVIDNFNYGSLPPILFDATDNKRYVGEINSTPGKVKFLLPPSAINKKMLLLNQEAASVKFLTQLTPKTFVNFADVNNQGNYLIISHPSLYNDGNGNNYVDQYRAYRSTSTGGGFNAKIYDINELTDQFAFGIKKHPAAVRDFVRFAKDNFAVTPKFIFIIGRGMTYAAFRTSESDPLVNKLDMVTTFGNPASDASLVALPGSTVPIFPVGRLAAVTGEEVNHYLVKVKQYEQAQQTSSPYIADKAWMKSILHVAGGKDADENSLFMQYMNGYKAIAQDSALGATVETFSKTSSGIIQQANSLRIEELFSEGLGVIGYFGHSSANTFEFNLSNPELYNNHGKYPFFNVSGCSAGNFYIFDPTRLTGNLTLSEKYVLANQKGSIAFLADSHFGIPTFLDYYNTRLYRNFSRNNYGGYIGDDIKAVIEELGGANPFLNFPTKIHLEEINLHGDPAIRINSSEKPDFAIEEPLVKINPSIISVADLNFDLKIKMVNLGKAVNDSMWVSVKRKLPNDSIKVLYNKKIEAIKNADSINLVVAITPLTDKGLNQIIVNIDYNNNIDELYETNNSVTKDFYIFEDELRPSFPYNFSIVNQSNITFVANTANALSNTNSYVMELDTTELFNSSWKKIVTKTGVGGIVEFNPAGVSYLDSTVYYWRVALVPTGTNPYIWNSSSFIYLPNSSAGFNQSHYYQKLKSSYENLRLGTDRKLVYPLTPRNLTIRTGLYPYYNYDKINVNLDLTQLELYGCKYNSIQVYVFDTVTLKPWENYNINALNGKFGSFKVCASGSDTTRHFFEFPYGTPQYRKAAMDFIDMIPAGMYVAITNLGYKATNTSFISDWQTDQTTLGAGKSLYHKLKDIGFTQIDSFTRNIPFLYFYQKQSPTFNPVQVVGAEDSSYIEQTIVLNSIIPEGTIISPAFGPAQSWSQLHWRGNSLDAVNRDSTAIQVWGVKSNGTTDLLATVKNARDTSLAFINAVQYPYLKLKMFNQDTINITPYQLNYWRINAKMVPEGAVAPNILFNMPDTVSQGEPIQFSIAFKNISQTPFDSLLKAKVIITDRNNVPHVIDIPARKALAAGDTLQIRLPISSTDYPGKNTLFLDVNPDNDQLEQYHYNNILYKDFYVREDKFNPLLDVTFDGVHILNKDIVSSKANILIKLKDESRYLALKDTALLKVQVRFPDQQIRTYHFGDSMVFIPADLNSGENNASIEFKPFFEEDGEYELIVSGKDVNGNKAGDLSYRVIFSVINKPMISNLLNYPNPFTSSTAFVFTITGSEVPQNMRIQILTVTGKIVREITKDELGPINIGRNITQFKWDGTDAYGQKLANGVYLYRVLTNLNGKSLDKYKSADDNTDKFFKKGYGKMYLMR